MAREQIRLQFGKYNGDEHWGFGLEVLGRDEHGLWLGGRRGTAMEKPGTLTKATADFVVLVPEEAWWVATFTKQPADRSRTVEVYVDVATPTTVNQGEAFTLDLDLDVVRRTGGTVTIEDEDEFERHSVEMGYPAGVVAAAREAAQAVKERVETGAAPFDGSHERWLARI